MRPPLVVVCRKLPLPDALYDYAKEHNFQLAAFAFDAEKESTRPPQIVRVRPTVIG